MLKTCEFTKISDWINNNKFSFCRLISQKNKLSMAQDRILVNIMHQTTSSQTHLFSIRGKRQRGLVNKPEKPCFAPRFGENSNFRFYKQVNFKHVRSSGIR